MTEEALRMAVHRLRGRFGQALRNEIGETPRRRSTTRSAIPARRDLHRLRAYALMEQGRFQEAERVARKTIRMDPDREGYGLLSWALIRRRVRKSTQSPSGLTEATI